MRKIGPLAVLACALVACSDASSPAGPSRLAPYIEARGDLTTQVIPGEYIVVLHDNVSDVAGAAAASGAAVTARWDAALRGYAVRASPGQLRAIRSDARVKFVEPNGVVSIDATQSPAPWGLDRIDQANLPLDNSYSYSTVGGLGVHAYIIDTGINHTHFEWYDKGNSRLGNHFDVITPGGSAADCNGHGSHVAGTLGGTTYGVAKKVTMHAVRVLNCAGSGNSTLTITGINWVVANRILPAVANMSLGGGFSQAVNNATTALVNAGVFTAVASGNGDIFGNPLDACSFSPASTPAATTVNASQINDSRASFSNYGTCTDIFAPGVGIQSAWIGSNTATAILQGTSMASPHVAGAAALYLASHVGKPGTPPPSPAEVDAELKNNAVLNAITNPLPGTPNRLLNISFLVGPPPNQAPVADFSITCQAGVSCIVDASSSTDDGGLANLSFTWTNSTGTRPTKTGITATYAYNVNYPARNSFTVTLTALDAGGLSHQVSKSVIIPPPAGGNQAPAADFTIACTASPRQCVLNAAPSTDDGGFANLTFGWTTDVGRPAKTGQMATYKYTSWPYPNSFNATLTATDAQGLTHSVTKPVVIP